MTAEAFCIANGPSLTEQDVELVRQWREGPDRAVYVCNNGYEIAPWADCLFAHDPQWWEYYQPDFAGRKVSPYQRPGVEHMPSWKMPSHGNSGAGSIMLALRDGAKHIGLIGYDLSKDEGRAHWHPDHPFSNCNSIKTWPEAFRLTAGHVRSAGAVVINCTRRTLLDEALFPRMALEDYLYCRQRPERQ